MNNKTIYLAYASPDMAATREELLFTLFNAGFNVLPLGNESSEESLLKKQITEGLNNSACSIHLIGNEFGKALNSEGGKSLSSYQYDQAREQLKEGKNFRIFVWHPHTSNESADTKQLDFISELQNNIAANMT